MAAPKRLILLSALVTLAACQRHPAPPAETATQSAASVAEASDIGEASQSSSASASSEAPEAPQAIGALGQKPGLWELTQSLPQMEATWKAKICVDAEQGQRLAMIGQDLLGKPEMSRLTCTRRGVAKGDGSLEADTVCMVNDTTLTSHIHADVIGHTVYHQTVETRYAPAFAGHGDQITVTDASWKGPCPDGMASGDFVNRDGVRSNVSKLLAKFR
jgi:phage-related tail fiber protein